MNAIRRIRLGMIAALVCLAAVAHADAPGDAWAFAKGAIAPNPFVVMGLNLVALKSSALFQQLFPQLLAQAGTAQDGLDKIKATCGIDVVGVVQGGVVAIDESQKGAIYLSTKGMSSAKVSECLSKLAASDATPKKVTASKPDAQGIVEYTVAGEDQKHLYVAYLPKNVVVICTDTFDKALLQKWLSGKGAGAGTPVARALGSVNTGAPFWMMVAQEKNLAPDVNATMKVIYGQADLAAGNVNGDIHVLTNSPKEATDLTAFAQKQLDTAKSSGSLPPQAITLMQSVRVASAGDELQLKASVPEKDALAFLAAALHGSH
jgi:hypothetical protein